MNFKVWARSAETGDFEICTCLMLKEKGNMLREGYFSDPEQNRQLIDWFFERSGYLNKKSRREGLLDTLFSPDAESEEREIWLEELCNIFDNFELTDTGTYLGYRKSGEFVEAAEALCRELPKDAREEAKLRAAVNLMMISRLPEELPGSLRRAILATWKREDEGAEQLREDRLFLFDWRDLPQKPLTAKVLSNVSDRALELKFRSQDGKYDYSVTLPKGGRLTACFAGRVVCALKGAIRANAGRSAMLSNEGLRLGLPGGAAKLYEEMKPVDFEIHPGGRLHQLSNEELKVIGGDGREKYVEKVVSVCALGTIWAALKADGSTSSNCAELVTEGVCALIRNEKTIFALYRDGRVLSLDEKEYTADEVIDSMMAPFTGCTGEMAEEVTHRGKRLAVSRDGQFHAG